LRTLLKQNLTREAATNELTESKLFFR